MAQHYLQYQHYPQYLNEGNVGKVGIMGNMNFKCFGNNNIKSTYMLVMLVFWGKLARNLILSQFLIIL